MEAAMRRSDEKIAVALLKHLGVLRPHNTGNNGAKSVSSANVTGEVRAGVESGQCLG